MNRRYRRIIAAQLVIIACAAAGYSLTLQRNVILGTNTTDLITWVDKAGQTRKAWIINDFLKTGSPMGGTLWQCQYYAGTTLKTTGPNSPADGLSGFGNTINHGNFPGACGGAWLNGNCDSYNPVVSILFNGDHHLVWECKSKLSIAGQGTEPSIWCTRTYVFKDGEDQWEYAVTFDSRHLGVDQVPSANTRTPYNNYCWWADASQYPKTKFGYGTTHKCDGDANTMTFDATQPYNLCPYVYSWYNQGGLDAEIGIVQTRLNGKHKAGCNASNNGKSGTFSGADIFDFQFADYQGWYGGRVCWRSAGPDGQGAIGVSPRTENYSLTCVLGTHTTNAYQRIINENNAVQAAGSFLTASVGAADSAGPEGAGLMLYQVWDKKGYDQLYRNWVVHANNNHITATLALAAAVSNPTFVLTNYTSSSKPSTVSKSGSALAEGTGYYASVDTASDQCWVTFLSDFSGTTTVDIAGPADQSGIAIGSFAAAPNSAALGTTTSITFSATISGATSASLDLRELGGASSVAMNQSGAGFIYTMPAASVVTEGCKMITLTAGSGTGSRIGVALVTVKRPDLVCYADAVTGTAASWTSGGSCAEVSSGAYEGTKCIQYQYSGTGNNSGITFNSDKDIRPYGYLVFAYKGPTNGQHVTVTIRSSDNWGANQIDLPPSTGYSLATIAVGDILNGVYINTTKVNELRFTISGSGSAGNLYIDDVYFTNWPLSIDRPTEVLTRATSGLSDLSQVAVRALQNRRGIRVLTKQEGIITVYTAAGKTVCRMKCGKEPGNITVGLKSAGMYVVNFTGTFLSRNMQLFVK